MRISKNHGMPAKSIAEQKAQNDLTLHNTAVLKMRIVVNRNAAKLIMISELRSL